MPACLGLAGTSSPHSRGQVLAFYTNDISRNGRSEVSLKEATGPSYNRKPASKKITEISGKDL